MAESKKTRSELKRNDILIGARKAFKKYGVSETSVDKISDTAQVSKRTLYNYFESKEELVTYIIRDIWANTIVNFDLSYDSTASLKPQLLELVLNELRFFQNEEFIELVRVAVNHTLFSHDNFRSELKQFFEQETALIRWLKAACDDKKLVDIDHLKANDQILSLIKGQALWPQILGVSPMITSDECTTIAHDTVELILSRYQPPSA